MKKYTFSLLLLLALSMLLLAYRQSETGIIKGSVTPQEATNHVFAISTKDTFEADINQGMFQINKIKPGNYTLVVAGRAPYRNYIKSDIVIGPGSFVDVGEIKMEK